MLRKKLITALVFVVVAMVTAVAITLSNRKTSATKKMTDKENTTAAAGDTLVQFHTTAGDFTVRLYGDTPKHRDNFLKLVREGYYDNVLFHRVINQFMVQTGDPDSKDAPAGKVLGRPQFKIIQTKEAKITCTPSLGMQFDGEIISSNSGVFGARALPQCLDLIVDEFSPLGK